MKKRKTIGILAGMGPKSTAPFIDMVINQCQKIYDAKDDIDFPPIMIYSLPTPFYVDRPINHKKMKDVVCNGLKKLEATGVDFIAIPCNTVHMYFDDLQKCVKIPLLNIVDESLKELKSGNVTVLATKPTMASGVYQKGIFDKKLKYIFQNEWQSLVNSLIKCVKAGEEDNAQRLWKKLTQLIINAGVDTVIVACTDLSKLPVMHGLKIRDSSFSLAKAVVEKYLE